MEIYILKKDNIPFYIGKSVNAFHRFYKHKKTYGININLDIIDIIPDNEWKFWEKHYISLYKSWGFILLNKNEGGGGPNKGRKIRPKDDKWKENLRIAHTGKIVSQETKNKMSFSKIGKPSGFLGKHHTEKTILKLKQVRNIPVYQYTIDGKFIKKWNNILEPSQKLNICKSSISYCSLNKLHYNTAGGFIWKRKYKKDIIKLINGNSKKIKKIDKEGNLICVYDSITQGALNDNVSKSKIIHSCKNKKNTYGKYKYQYV
jgi:hypothetical protein